MIGWNAIKFNLRHFCKVPSVSGYVQSGRDLGFHDKPIVDLRYELSTALKSVEGECT